MTAPTSGSGLSHVGADGRARMVNVGDKPVTDRLAIAEAIVTLSPAWRAPSNPTPWSRAISWRSPAPPAFKRPKRTDELIPLCHSLPLDHAEVLLSLEGTTLTIRAEARCHARTGGDGSADCRRGRRPDRDRHGQGDRQIDPHRRPSNHREIGRTKRPLSRAGENSGHARMKLTSSHPCRRAHRFGPLLTRRNDRPPRGRGLRRSSGSTSAPRWS